MFPVRTSQRTTMSKATTNFRPTRFSFTVRFVQGYRFLDKCGEAIVRLEETLDPGWIPAETIPTGGQLRNYTLGMGAKFHSESLTVTQSEFLSFDVFHDQCCKIYEVLRSTFEIRRVLTPVLRVICQVGFPDVEAAEEFLRELDLCTMDPDLCRALGGRNESLSFTLCTQDDIEWYGMDARRRRRCDVRAIRQERQPFFDERLVQRIALLPERYRDAMQGLRKLRTQHADIREHAVQIDFEDSFETEFNSRNLDLPTFLTEARAWSERMETFFLTRFRKI